MYDGRRDRQDINSRLRADESPFFRWNQYVHGQLTALSQGPPFDPSHILCNPNTGRSYRLQKNTEKPA
jgi:hypothetical protein